MCVCIMLVHVVCGYNVYVLYIVKCIRQHDRARPHTWTFAEKVRQPSEIEVKLTHMLLQYEWERERERERERSMKETMREIVVKERRYEDTQGTIAYKVVQLNFQCTGLCVCVLCV